MQMFTQNLGTSDSKYELGGEGSILECAKLTQTVRDLGPACLPVSTPVWNQSLLRGTESDYWG